MADQQLPQRLPPEILQRLSRLTTPTVYNGWELITRRNAASDCFNIEETRDFAPQLGAMVGYAVTAKVQVGGPRAPDNRRRWGDFRAHVAAVPGPKIVVVQDLDKPRVYGSIWGEIAANTFRSLGCVGTITDGGARDLDEMAAAGFKAIARRACAGHGVGTLVEFDCEVDVFGVNVAPGRLIHADQHGFLVIPPEDEPRLVHAAEYLHTAEADLLRAARNSAVSHEAFLAQFDAAIEVFVNKAKGFAEGRGEW